jgi:multicomponent Na+:H+ antiporter subunit E
MKTAQASVALFAFWLILTGSVVPLDLIIGLGFSVLLGYLSARFLWATDAPTLSLQQGWRFLLYLPRLIVNIVLSALQVAEVVLAPRMPINPVIVGHRTSFAREVSRAAYANSITMTPGTLTVDIDENTFHIHCLDEKFANDIASGDLERRIARVFEE